MAEAIMSDAKQDQRSQQSTGNPAGKPQQGPSDKSQQESRTGIGSSQAQDREGRRDNDSVPHTGHGTADIERASADAQGKTESLADDPVGAFKERP
jgi:hypothetical protein